MNIETLLAASGHLDEFVSILDNEDIAFLVALLTEKDDKIRYAAFLTLQKRSEIKGDIYPYWNVFASKLDDENSYQRSIGIMLIAENVKWDDKKLFGTVFDSYMSHCTDEKFVTCRQTIQAIPKWAKYAPEHLDGAVLILTAIDIGSFKDTQRKLILIDILNALAAISEIKPSDKITRYMYAAVTGGVLDKKSAKQFEKFILSK